MESFVEHCAKLRRSLWLGAVSFSALLSVWLPPGFTWCVPRRFGRRGPPLGGGQPTLEAWRDAWPWFNAGGVTRRVQTTISPPSHSTLQCAAPTPDHVPPRSFLRLRSTDNT